MQILPGFFYIFLQISPTYRIFIGFFIIFPRFSPTYPRNPLLFLVHIGHFGPTTNKNLFSESATLFCLCPLGVLMMDDDSWSQGNSPL